jgi:hypothetical protein
MTIVEDRQKRLSHGRRLLSIPLDQPPDFDNDTPLIPESSATADSAALDNSASTHRVVTSLLDDFENVILKTSERKYKI